MLLERKWRQTCAPTDLDRFKKQRKVVSAMLDTAKSNYFPTKISDCGKDAKSLYRTLYDLLGRKKSTKLPELGSLDEIAEAFSTYFDK